MNCNEFISQIKSHGAQFAPPATPQQITLTNSALQHIRAAILPTFITELYLQCGAINLGTGYIFGPSEIARGTKYPIPNILQINQDLTAITKLRGKTVFGRNDLFWFAFDAFGKCFMLDNTTLNTLRQYDNPYNAMIDCLMAGKI